MGGRSTKARSNYVCLSLIIPNYLDGLDENLFFCFCWVDETESMFRKGIIGRIMEKGYTHRTSLGFVLLIAKLTGVGLVTHFRQIGSGI